MDPEKMLAAYEAKKTRIEEKIVDAWESHGDLALISLLKNKLKKYTHKLRRAPQRPGLPRVVRMTKPKPNA